MITMIIASLVSFVVALAVTPLVRWWALERGFLDQAGASRKIHTQSTPRLGGIAIVLAFFAPLVPLIFLDSDVGNRFMAVDHFLAGLMAGGGMIALLGLYDDLRGADAKLKFSVQLVAATLVYHLGFQINGIDLPFLPGFQLGLFSYPVTVLWIVGVTNAVNLIDGLDGLAAGLSVCTAATMLILGIVNGDLVLSLLSCAMVGALLGFLVHNFHPAKIFMGDTGSLFLGFTLALITVKGAQKGTSVVAMLTPILAMGLPIMDTLLAVARRAWRGQRLFLADRDHIHHRLIDKGLGHRNTVLVMYAFSVALASLGLVTAIHRDLRAGLALLGAVTVCGILIRWLGFGRGLYPRLAKLSRFFQESHTTRVRNQELRKVSKNLVETANLDTAFLAIEELGAILGVCRLELQMDSDHDRQTIRTWEFHPATAVQNPAVQIRLAIDDISIGQLNLHWPEEPPEASDWLPTAQESCSKIAQALNNYRNAENKVVQQPESVKVAR